MAVNLKGRSFLTLMDFTPEEIRYMGFYSRSSETEQIVIGTINYLQTRRRAGLFFWGK